MMEIWTVTANPDDFPGLHVARLWKATGAPDPVDTGLVFTGHTLDEVRSMLPRGLLCFPRDPSDPPCVVETWL